MFEGIAAQLPMTKVPPGNGRTIHLNSLLTCCHINTMDPLPGGDQPGDFLPGKGNYVTWLFNTILSINKI